MLDRGQKAASALGSAQEPGRGPTAHPIGLEKGAPRAPNTCPKSRYLTCQVPSWHSRRYPGKGPPGWSCPPGKASHRVTPVPIHPCKRGMEIPVDGDPGVSLEEWAWERRDFSFSCMLYTFELTEVFTRVYQVL